jgi:hypothetical protein
MNDSISMFIDNELNLDGKIGFVKRVHKEEEFYSETVDLLEQEKLLRSEAVPVLPQASVVKARKKLNFRSFIPLFRVAEFGVMAALILFFISSLQPRHEDLVAKRFVIFQPEASSVQISGSFTDWKDIPMKMIGPSGYWEIELDVTKGEHKYVFIVGDDKKIADPTILMRERDDFGSENTVLDVEA